LEKNLSELNTRLDRLMIANTKQHNLLDNLISLEETDRKQEAKSLSDKLETTETGGLDLSLLGAFWIALGIVMATASGT
jgi:hypothetical protein